LPPRDRGGERAEASAMNEDGMASAPPGEGPLAIICGAGSLAVCGRRFGTPPGPQHRSVRAARMGDPGRVASYPHRWVRFGQFGPLCRTARQEGCRDVVFIGSVVRPALWQIWPDLATLRVMPRVIRMFTAATTT